jgi:hypothetical protein
MNELRYLSKNKKDQMVVTSLCKCSKEDRESEEGGNA